MKINNMTLYTISLFNTASLSQHVPIVIQDKIKIKHTDMTYFNSQCVLNPHRVMSELKPKVAQPGDI